MPVITNRIYRDSKYSGPNGEIVRRELTDVTVDGVAYCQTGSWYGTGGVFCRAADWGPRPFTPGSDHLLFVFDEERMIPLPEWKARNPDRTLQPIREVRE